MKLITSEARVTSDLAGARAGPEMSNLYEFFSVLVASSVRDTKLEFELKC